MFYLVKGMLLVGRVSSILEKIYQIFTKSQSETADLSSRGGVWRLADYVAAIC